MICRYKISKGEHGIGNDQLMLIGTTDSFGGGSHIDSLNSQTDWIFCLDFILRFVLFFRFFYCLELIFGPSVCFSLFVHCNIT